MDDAWGFVRLFPTKPAKYWAPDHTPRGRHVAEIAAVMRCEGTIELADTIHPSTVSEIIMGIPDVMGLSTQDAKAGFMNKVSRACAGRWTCGDLVKRTATSCR